MPTNNAINSSNPMTVTQGGTSLATLTSNALYVGNGISAPNAIAVGSTGQILQANTTADPTWSTATYPSTATGTGKILRGDGTNFLASTATYPDTAGTSGNVLTSDGTNWISSAVVGPGGLTYVSLNINSSQIKNLHATPIIVVAAPGVGFSLCVLNPIFTRFNYGGNNTFVAGASQDIQLNYNKNSTQKIATVLNSTGIQSSSTGYTITSGATNGTISTNKYENLPIQLYNSSSTEISGNASNDNSVTVGFFYYTLTQ